MNNLEIKGDWNVIKEKIKQEWGNLIDDDLLLTEGNNDELLNHIQMMAGEKREQIEKTLNCICRS